MSNHSPVDPNTYLQIEPLTFGASSFKCIMRAFLHSMTASLYIENNLTRAHENGLWKHFLPFHCGIDLIEKHNGMSGYHTYLHDRCPP